MKSRKQWLQVVSTLCAELTPEDGIDPRKTPHRQTHRKTDRKTHQVCKQVERTINLLITAGELGELRELTVSAVEPYPDSTHLLIIMEPAIPTALLDEQAVIVALERVKGHLRSVIANTINRKRTPQLSFEFIARGIQ